MTIQINTYTELEKWLAENDYFEEGEILHVEPNPLSITIRRAIKENHLATEQRLASFKLTPNRVIKWNYNLDDFATSKFISCIKPSEINTNIALEFLAISTILLIAESLTIQILEITKTHFQPYLSYNSIHIKAPLKEIPRPRFWIEKLKECGHNAVFRYFSGKAKLPEEIPYPNYTGYFIQYANKIDDTDYGILIDFMEIKNNTILLFFKLEDETLNDMWINLTSILANIPKVKIFCGNCELTGEEWKQILKDHLYPPSD